MTTQRLQQSYTPAPGPPSTTPPQADVRRTPCLTLHPARHPSHPYEGCNTPRLHRQLLLPALGGQLRGRLPRHLQLRLAQPHAVVVGHAQLLLVPLPVGAPDTHPQWQVRGRKASNSQPRFLKRPSRWLVLLLGVIGGRWYLEGHVVGRDVQHASRLVHRDLRHDLPDRSARDARGRQAEQAGTHHVARQPRVHQRGLSMLTAICGECAADVRAY